ncbi:unnamed protein product [Rotaria sp. Silwood2]|nr:unnamed protein product [Rotaria sp. Silwood2]
MHSVFIMLIYFLPYITTQNSTVLYSKYRWLQLPATPKLSPYPIGQYAEINNILIWYTIYGSDNAIPLLFLHGGFANSDYWGLQVGELKSLYRCILMDSRGQGRSFTSSTNITYDLMTSDVIALLDYLNIERVHVVGWSDGGIIGLNLAMNYQNRLISLFAFGASYVPTGAKDVFISPVFMAYIERTKVEYEAMNPVKDYSSLYNNLTSMWAILPNWTQQDFERIDKNLPIWIVDGDHEEAIFRSQPDDMTSWIPQASELILPGTGHFAFIQDPVVFTAFVKHFVTEIDCPSCIDMILASSAASSIFYLFHVSIHFNNLFIIDFLSKTMAERKQYDQCTIGQIKRVIWTCQGCSSPFCADHCKEHRQYLSAEFDREVVQVHDKVREKID